MNMLTNEYQLTRDWGDTVRIAWSTIRLALLKMMIIMRDVTL